MNLSELLTLLQQAHSPADIFGLLAPGDEAALRQSYRRLAAIAHPDHNPHQPAEAHGAFRLLQSWYAAAQRQIGSSPQIMVATQRDRYVANGPPIRGDLCDLYAAEAKDGPVLLKIARSTRNNDLLDAEATALRNLSRALDGQPLRAHFPALVEHARLRDEAGNERSVNVLHAECDYVSLTEVLRACPRGLPLADAAWMFNRMLAALGAAHQCGLVYGAVLPAHMLVRPADHNGMLLDWCYSVPVGQPIKASSPPHAADYPPEVAARVPATPATDLYMAARVMVRLLGGSGDASTLPEHVPRSMQALLRSCLLPAPQRRASDAWQLFDNFRDLLQRHYGPPQFRPFVMPA
jgi:hypothetical protein